MQVGDEVSFKQKFRYYTNSLRSCVEVTQYYEVFSDPIFDTLRQHYCFPTPYWTNCERFCITGGRGLWLHGGIFCSILAWNHQVPKFFSEVHVPSCAHKIKQGLCFASTFTTTLEHGIVIISRRKEPRLHQELETFVPDLSINTPHLLSHCIVSWGVSGLFQYIG